MLNDPETAAMVEKDRKDYWRGYHQKKYPVKSEESENFAAAEDEKGNAYIHIKGKNGTLAIYRIGERDEQHINVDKHL